MSEVKRGMLKFYHRGLLSKKWKMYKFILYESSLLTWYADVKHKKPDGMVLLKDVERFICVGPYTRFLPDFPHLDDECDQVALIAFPQTIKDRDRDIIWLLCEDVDDLNAWMKAIVQTLPSKTLEMERFTTLSTSSADEHIPSVSELNSPEIRSPDRVLLSSNNLGLPLAAGLLATRLQGHTMNSKQHPLQKAGYDYGDTLWGTGEGWGYFSPAEVPGYAGIGGSGCYANHIDLIRNEEDEQRLKDAEDRINAAETEEEAVEQATYELSKNQIEDDGEEQDNGYSFNREEEEEENVFDTQDNDDPPYGDELDMIDNDTDE